MFPYIEIIGRTIGTYGLMACIGCLAACTVLYFLIKRGGKDINDTVIFLVMVMVGVFLGGHLLYGLTNLPRFDAYLTVRDIQDFFKVTAELFGGSVFYGGLLGAIATGLLAIRILRLDKAFYADAMGVVAPLFHGIARIGCFFAGCCYGVECAWGFTAHNNPYVPSVNGVSRFPIQLLEAALNFAIFALVMALYNKKRLQGKLFFVYLACYAPLRFANEFLRGDKIRGFAFGLSTSQLISIPVGAVAIAVLLVHLVKKRKN